MKIIRNKNIDNAIKIFYYSKFFQSNPYGVIMLLLSFLNNNFIQNKLLNKNKKQISPISDNDILSSIF